jgi:hypothetical protein
MATQTKPHYRHRRFKPFDLYGSQPSPNVEAAKPIKIAVRPQMSALWRLVDSLPSDRIMRSLLDELTSAGVQFVSVRDNAAESSRVALTAPMFNRSPLANYCDRMIIHVGASEESRMKIISVMPPAPERVTTRNAQHVRQSIINSEIIPIDEGTSIGLYWFDSQWIIRSANGYNVGDLSWNDSITFRQALADVMAKYPEFTLERLDKNKCYTIGFHHPAYHPFLEGKAEGEVRAWFVEAVDLTKLNVQYGLFAGAITYDDAIGLPLQKAISIADYDACMEASGISMFMDSGNVYYGLLIRAPDRTYIYHSDLFTFISKTWYDAKKNNLIKREGYDRTKYIVLEAVLQGEAIQACFTKLFPQLAEQVERADTFLDYLASAMDSYDHSIARDDSIFHSDVYSPCIQSLARRLHGIWCQKYGSAPAQESRVEQYSSFIRATRWLEPIYDALYQADTTAHHASVGEMTEATAELTLASPDQPPSAEEPPPLPSRDSDS